ncbi:MAG TPA: iron-containing redox enzyme family protein [Kofleriaceae bacterium]|nr:iron-containing redox enzyme family protein [Kofleriaceae bacterium]
MTGTWRSLLEERRSWSLDPAVAPALGRLVKLERERDTVTALSIGTKRISFGGGSEDRITRLLGLMDGRRTIRELAAETDEDLDELVEILGRLYKVAAVWNHADCPVPSGALVSHLDHLCQAFQMELGARICSVREALESRRSRRLVVGYLFEAFHYVSGAAIHFSPAIAMAPTHRSRMILSEMLAEEYWHGELLRTGLRKLDFSDDDIARSDPLAGTLAIVNCLRGAAMTSMPEYAACVLATEAGSEALGGHERQAREVVGFWEFLGRDGVIPPEALKPFAEHDLVDVEHGHQSYAAEILCEYAMLTGQQQESARRTMLMYLQTVGERERQLVQFYGAPEGPPFFTADELPVR